MFNDFGFLLYYLENFSNSIAECGADGYSISFDKSIDRELEVPLKNENGTYFPFTNGKQVTMFTDKSQHDRFANVMDKLFEDLQSMESYHVTLRWKREVLVPDNPDTKQEYLTELAIANARRPDKLTALYYPDKAEFNLHDYACVLLKDVFNTASAMDVLLASHNSLLVVHIVALALRGIIRVGIGEVSSLTSAEKLAMSGTTYSSKPENVGPFTSLLLSLTTEESAEKNQGEAPSSRRVSDAGQQTAGVQTPMQRLFEEKMKMSYAKYRSLQDEELSPAGAGGNTNSAVPEDDDFADENDHEDLFGGMFER